MSVFPDVHIETAVEAVKLAKKYFDPRTGRIHPKGWHARFNEPVYTLAFLYRTPHPANPYFGDREILAMARKIGNAQVKAQHADGLYSDAPGNSVTIEWPPYTLNEAYGLLHRELGAKEKKAWAGSVLKWAKCVRGKPMFFTSPNHECWRSLTLYRIGTVHRRPDLKITATRQLAQLLKLQTSFGFWEESRHNGPSMSYNFVMVQPLAIMYDLTGDKELYKALKKLVGFIVDYSYPDGTPVETFDGRQPYAGAGLHMTAGFSFFPKGRRLLEKRLEFAEKLRGQKTEKEMTPKEVHSAGSASHFAIACYLHYREGKSAPLAQEKSTYLRSADANEMRGGVSKRNGWFHSFCGIISDVTRISTSPYRTDRQSRISVWHESTGLIVGGGSTFGGVDLPMANAHVVTDFKNVDVTGGAINLKNLYYAKGSFYPREAFVKMGLKNSEMTLVFGHGDINFSARPAGENKFVIDFEADVIEAKKVFIQLPLALFAGDKVFVDGKVVPAGKKRRAVPAKKEVRISRSLTGKNIRISVPARGRTVVQYPVNMLYGPLTALISTEISRPKGIFRGKFEIKIR